MFSGSVQCSDSMYIHLVIHYEYLYSTPLRLLLKSAADLSTAEWIVFRTG